MQLSLPFAGVPYRIVRSPRRTIGVVVRSDGSVEVRAPLRAADTAIRKVVDEFGPWIERKRREAHERRARAELRRFEDGDAIPFLGTDLRLRAAVASDGRATVTRRGDELFVDLPAATPRTQRHRETRLAVVRWLLEQARDVFHERHVAMAQRTGLSARRVVIKDMRTRWGSCGPDRRMNLNWRLVLAPRDVVDYVLVHELAHIEVPDHSRAFWRRVAKACPHWRESRRWLRRHGDDLEL